MCSDSPSHFNIHVAVGIWYIASKPLIGGMTLAWLPLHTWNIDTHHLSYTTMIVICTKAKNNSASPCTDVRQVRIYRNAQCYRESDYQPSSYEINRALFGCKFNLEIFVPFYSEDVAVIRLRREHGIRNVWRKTGDWSCLLQKELITNPRKKWSDSWVWYKGKARGIHKNNIS